MSPTSGTLASATGTIFDVFGLTSETVTGGSPNANRSNVYSLQMNTNPFSTPACKTSANASCNGVVQFVFDNNDTSIGPATSYINITWLLNNYGPTCPNKTWVVSRTTCYLSFTGTTFPVVPLSGFTNFVLTGGYAAGKDYDTITLGTGKLYGYAYSGGSPLSLGSALWNQVQFNVFGDKTSFSNATGANANFNPGATMQVKTILADQAGLSDTCAQNSFTAETANLTSASPCTVLGGTSPGIQWVQGASPINVSISTTSGPAAGNTPITVTGTGFTSNMIANFNGITVVPACNSTGQCSLATPAGPPNVAVDVQMANVSPVTGVVGVYSSATPADRFTYSPAPPSCNFTTTCLQGVSGPPSFTYSCPAISDFYEGTNLAPNASPPPAYVLTGTTLSGVTTDDFNFYVEACVQHSTSSCTSKSLFVSSSQVCKGGPGSGGNNPPKTCGRCGGLKCCPDPSGGPGTMCVPPSRPCPAPF